MEAVDIKAIREKLGLSQGDLAALVGFSVRAIQSCEQGWRKPSPALEKMLLLLYVAELQGSSFGTERCWEMMGCAPETRDTCVAYRSRQGHLCWFLTGTLCRGQRMGDWLKKRATCADCAYFRRLMTPSPETMLEPGPEKPDPRPAEHE
jgi:DNA-binding XRE family transcriptional regulator